MLRKISWVGVFVIMTLQVEAQTWHDADLTALGGGPNTTGPNAVIYDLNVGVIRSHYIASDNHVHEVNLDKAHTKWADNDLSALGGATVNALGPIAHVFGGVPSVIRSHYIGFDNHVHELFLDANGWHDMDLSAQGGATVNAVGAIASLYDPNVNTTRIHYMASDNRVHELALSTIITDTLAWVDGDLTAQAGATVGSVGSALARFEAV